MKPDNTYKPLKTNNLMLQTQKQSKLHYVRAQMIQNGKQNSSGMVGAFLSNQRQSLDLGNKK